MPRHELVDLRFEILHHRGVDQRDAPLKALPVFRVRGEIRPDHEQVSLELQDQGLDVIVMRVSSGHTERRDRFVHGPVGLRCSVGLGDAAAVEEPGGPVIAGLRVDPHRATG